MSDEIQKKQIIDYTSTTTLATGDKLLLQKADGTTMNVDYAELARNIITQYNAQTLAGSAQSIQSAFAALNSNLSITPVLLTDCHDATDPRKIYYADGTTENKPTNNWYFIRVVGANGTIRTLYAYLMNTLTPVAYMKTNTNNGVWSDWKKVPTQSDFDTLNNSLTNKTFVYSGYKSNVTSVVIDSGMPLTVGRAFLVVVRVYPDSSRITNNVYVITLHENGTWIISTVSEESPNSKPSSVTTSDTSLTFSFGSALYGSIGILRIV